MKLDAAVFTFTHRGTYVTVYFEHQQPGNTWEIRIEIDYQTKGRTDDDWEGKAKAQPCPAHAKRLYQTRNHWATKR